MKDTKKDLKAFREFMRFRDGWIDFYKKLNLMKHLFLNKSFRWETFVDISKINKSFMVVFLPSIENQKKCIVALKTVCESSIPNGIWISPHTVRCDLIEGSNNPQDIVNFLNSLEFKDRPNNPYLLILEDYRDLPQKTRVTATDDVDSGADLIKILVKDGEVGLNLFEYLVFRYSYILNHGNYLKDSGASWLFGSILPNGNSLVVAEETNQLKVWSWPLKYKERNFQGVRCGRVVSLV